VNVGVFNQEEVEVVFLLLLVPHFFYSTTSKLGVNFFSLKLHEIS